MYVSLASQILFCTWIKVVRATGVPRNTEDFWQISKFSYTPVVAALQLRKRLTHAPHTLLTKLNITLSTLDAGSS